MQAVQINPNQVAQNIAISCGNCGSAEKKLQICARCHFMQYCGTACQKSHWPKHKHVCQLLPNKKDCLQQPGAFWLSFVNDHEQEIISWHSRDKIVGPLPPGCFPEMLRLAATRSDEIGYKNKKQALDLGCGAGYSSTELLQSGWSVRAVDKLPQSIRLLQKLANLLDKTWLETKQLTTVLATIEDYEFPTGVNLIIVSDVLPYCNPTQLRKIWDKIYSALDDENGWVVGSFFVRGGKGEFLWLMEGAWFIKDPDEVSHLLNAMSFEVIECRRRPKPEDPIPSAVIEFCARKKT
jgi:SAM-dependent methyltransferase